MSKFVEAMETGTKDSGQAKDKESSNKTNCVMNIQGYPVKGLSIAGHETCIIFPSLNIAFDIGRCPHQAIQQDFVCISHAHMDHIVSVPSVLCLLSLCFFLPCSLYCNFFFKKFFFHSLCLWCSGFLLLFILLVLELLNLVLYALFCMGPIRVFDNLVSLDGKY